MNRAQISAAYSLGQVAHYYPPERYTTLFCLNTQTAMRHLNDRCWASRGSPMGRRESLRPLVKGRSRNPR
jgi:hypothetical protein